MPDPDPACTICFCLFALLFLLLNTILTLGSEAFDAVGDSRIRELEEDGSRRAHRIRRMTEHENRFSDRIHTGWLLNGAVAALALYHGMASLPHKRLNTLGQPYAAIVLVLLAATATVFCLTVFGYRLPRRLAQKAPEKTALGITPLFSAVYALLWPLDRLCALIVYPLLRLCRVDPHTDDEQVTEEDIRELMDVGEESGSIEGTQKDMVNNIFEFDDTTAAEIMTPRTDVVAIEADEDVMTALPKAVENGYSRLPIYEEDIDHIIGLLYIKDLLPYVGQVLPPQVTIRRLMRETYFVPDTKKCDDLFEEMNEKHLQMAIVVDEYGGVAGIVTIEDLLESIVGNMQDEFDHETEEITQLDEHSFEVDGALNIGELSELLDTKLPEGDYDTVAGFLMDQLGHIPEETEEAAVRFDNITFTILQMDDRRIEQVLVKVEPKTDDNGEEA